MQILLNKSKRENRQNFLTSGFVILYRRHQICSDCSIYIYKTLWCIQPDWRESVLQSIFYKIFSIKRNWSICTPYSNLKSTSFFCSNNTAMCYFTCQYKLLRKLGQFHFRLYLYVTLQLIVRISKKNVWSMERPISKGLLYFLLMFFPFCRLTCP